ncbi:MAG: leucine-rich repeat protein [Paramuribaculum sp.]|nr:leucine-rich repeat protein [Paramuribaculum sp.]
MKLQRESICAYSVWLLFAIFSFGHAYGEVKSIPVIQYFEDPNSPLRPTPPESETIDWWFDIDRGTGTATIVAPPDSPYSFGHPGAGGQLLGSGYSFWTPNLAGIYGEADQFTAIRIPSTITDPEDNAVYTVTAIGSEAFAKSNVAFIHVPSTIMSIGDMAFAGCAGLKGIETVSAYELVPNSVTELGIGVFKDCTSLLRVDIGDGLSIIPAETFDGCTSLTQLKIGMNVRRIECQLPELKRIAFHSSTPPSLLSELNADEVWVPAEHTASYRSAFPSLTVKPFSITVNQPDELKFYKSCFRSVRFNLTTAPMKEADCTDKYFFVYRAVDYGGFGIYKEKVSIALDNDKNDLPYTILFSDPLAGLITSTATYPHSGQGFVYVAFNRTGEFELTIVSNDITRTRYTWKVNVVDGTPVDDLYFTGPTAVRPGETASYTPVFTGKTPSVTDVVWASSDESVFTVDADGTVHGVTPGVAYLTMTSADPACPDASYLRKIYVSDKMTIELTDWQIIPTGSVIAPGKTPEYDDSHSTIFHVNMAEDPVGVITSPGREINPATNLPVTPYNFTFAGLEQIKQGKNKLMYSDAIVQMAVSLTSCPDYWSAYDTPLRIPNYFTDIHDGRVDFIGVGKVGDYAFAGSNVRYCNLYYSDFMGYEITEIGDYAFAGCKEFKGIPEGSVYDVVPDQITKMGRGVFKDCSAMEIMMIGDGVDELPEETFDGCSSLRQVRVGAKVKVIKCDIHATERIAFASESVPLISVGYSVSAPEIWVPASAVAAYKEAWPDANILPYSLTVERGKTGIGSYVGTTRNLIVNQSTAPLSEGCPYIYPYPTAGKTSVVHTTTVAESRRPRYRVDFGLGYIYSVVPTIGQTAVRYNTAVSDVLTFTALDITRAKVSVNYKVKSGVAVSSVSITSSGSDIITRGTTKNFVAKVVGAGNKTPTNSKVFWSTSDPKIATIDQSGVLTAHSKGKVTVTVRTLDPMSDEKSASYVVEVRNPYTGLNLYRLTETGKVPVVNGSELTGDVGDEITLTVKVSPTLSEQAPIEWTLDKDGVCTFDKNSLTIKLEEAGTCELTAKISGENTYSTKDIVRTVKIIVNEPEEPEPPVVDPEEPEEPEPGEPDDPSSAVTKPSGDATKVYTDGDMIVVEGARSGTQVSVYAPDGSRIAIRRADESRMTFAIWRRGIYLVVAGRVYKVAL